MTRLETIRMQLEAGEFELRRHALRRMVERNISAVEVEEAGAAAEIIEDYPDDKYSPSVLLLGFTSGGRPLHFQVSLVEAERTKIVTMYEPEPSEWVDFRKRR